MFHKDNNISLPLDLSTAPKVIFFFGMSGAGKSYVGDIIGEYNKDSFVYHADDDITQEMRQALANNAPFTDVMRDAFFDIVANKVNRLINEYDQIIITQGAYRQRHRDFLMQQIADMDMIWVDASQDIIHERLSHRSNGISIASANALMKDFEEPPEPTKSISNTKDGNYIIEQLNYHYSGHQSLCMHKSI